MRGARRSRRRHSTDRRSERTLTVADCSNGSTPSMRSSISLSSAPIARSNARNSSIVQVVVVVAPRHEREQRRDVVDRRGAQQQHPIVADPRAGLVERVRAHHERQVERRRHALADVATVLVVDVDRVLVAGEVGVERPRRGSARRPGRCRVRSCRHARTGSGRRRRSCRPSGWPTPATSPCRR